MDSDTLVTVFGAGGPLVIIMAFVTFIVKEWRAHREERRTAPRVAAESDSAVVSATKDIVELIRSEIKEAVDSRNIALLRAEAAERRIDQLELQEDVNQRTIRKLRHQIEVFRAGGVPNVIVEETIEVTSQ